jgi:hypothetical protein
MLSVKHFPQGYAKADDGPVQSVVKYCITIAQSPWLRAIQLMASGGVALELLLLVLMPLLLLLLPALP